MALRLGLGLMVTVYALFSFQLVAAYAGIREYTEWHWAVCVLLTITVGWTPLLGSGLAIYGAIYHWGWHWLPATAVCGWMLLIVPVFMYAEAQRQRGTPRPSAE